MKLYLNFDRVLTAAETDALRESVRRRGQREPLQHITGSTSFCGHEISVNRNVLVPRPETELLAELGWQFINRADNRLARLIRGRATSRPGEFNRLGFLHRQRLHRHRGGREMSAGQDRGDGYFDRRPGPGRENALKTTSPNGLYSCRGTVLPPWKRLRAGICVSHKIGGKTERRTVCWTV